jgi:peptidoglycan hydrolase-like protein with peptidoglycan-binding domain
MNTIKNLVATVIITVFIIAPLSTVQAIGAPYPELSFQKNLSYKQCDNDVQILQNYLVSHNFLPTGTVVTGNFDSATVKAVKKFQRSVGLKSDGIVGPKTRAFLNKENAKLKPVVLEPGQQGTGLLSTARCVYDKIPVSTITDEEFTGVITNVIVVADGPMFIYVDGKPITTSATTFTGQGGFTGKAPYPSHDLIGKKAKVFAKKIAGEYSLNGSQYYLELVN